MSELKEWRGFNISDRCQKIKRAFNLEEVNSPEDIPLIVNTPCYFGFGNNSIPKDYWSNPESMVKYQENGFEEHLKKVNDDTVPYFMPWFGTGVLASAFGCKINQSDGPVKDPSIAGPCIKSESDVKNLKMPNPEKDGLMPRVLKTIDYAKDNSDLPPGLTDMNSPLSTVAQMCGYDRLFIWMYDKPTLVHKIFEIVTNALIEWVKVQKKHIGEPLNQSNGLQGVWTPRGVGIWLSDDDLVAIGPEQYQKFVVPNYSRIFKEFGGGSLHFCGNGVHQIKNILTIENLRAINNSPCWNFEAFGQLVKSIEGKVTIQIQDNAPVKIEDYYPRLFDQISDLKGIMLATFVLDDMGLNNEGGLSPVNWDPFEAANRILKVIRECVAYKLEDNDS